MTMLVICVRNVAGPDGARTRRRRKKLKPEKTEKQKRKTTPAGTTPPAITRPGSFMTPFGVPPPHSDNNIAIIIILNEDPGPGHYGQTLSPMGVQPLPWGLPGPNGGIQMIITRPSEGLRSSSRVCPIQVDRPGARGIVPEAVALL